jgi:hypothetical protein
MGRHCSRRARICRQLLENVPRERGAVAARCDSGFSVGDWVIHLVAAKKSCLLILFVPTNLYLVWSVTAAHIAARMLQPNGLLMLTGALGVARLQPTPGMLAYGAAKAAVAQIFRSMAAPGAGLAAGARTVLIAPYVSTQVSICCSTTSVLTVTSTSRSCTDSHKKNVARSLSASSILKLSTSLLSARRSTHPRIAPPCPPPTRAHGRRPPSLPNAHSNGPTMVTRSSNRSSRTRCRMAASRSQCAP